MLYASRARVMSANASAALAPVSPTCTISAGPPAGEVAPPYGLTGTKILTRAGASSSLNCLQMSSMAWRAFSMPLVCGWRDMMVRLTIRRSPKALSLSQSGKSTSATDPKLTQAARLQCG